MIKLTDASALQSDCADYIALLQSPPNGWGQHCHPSYGQSHHMLAAISARHGDANVRAELNRQFATMNETWKGKIQWQR